jgi:uncharacterized hydrophobic protein (TIGR00271 family)
MVEISPHADLGFSFLCYTTSMSQPKEAHRNILATVEDEMQMRRSYFILLISSTIIATLGLLIDNTAVVIGAMLISPLFWPLMGLTVSFFTSERHLMGRALKAGGLSILIVLATSMVIAIISPLSADSREIAQRINPTLIDLFIALASSVIGVTAVYYPRVSQTAAGVAISIALLPALCVTGIGIVERDWDMFYGSLLLFATNTGAIFFAGGITLYVLWLRRKRNQEEQRVGMGFAATFTILLVLAIPLSVYLRDSIRQTAVITQVNQVLLERVSTLSPQARVDDVIVDYVASLQSDVEVQATVYVPEGYIFTQGQQQDMIGALSSATNRTVDLQLNVVDTVLLRQEEDRQLANLRESMQARVTELGQQLNPLIETESVDILIGEDDVPITVLYTVQQIEGEETLTFVQKEEIRNRLEQEFGRAILLEVSIIPIERLQEPDAISRYQTAAAAIVRERFLEWNQQAQLQSVNVSVDSEVLALTVIANVPQEMQIGQKRRDEITAAVEEFTDLSVTIEYRLYRFDTIE